MKKPKKPFSNYYLSGISRTIAVYPVVFILHIYAITVLVWTRRMKKLNKALRSYIFICINVSCSWLNGWTEWAEPVYGNPCSPLGEKIRLFVYKNNFFSSNFNSTGKNDYLHLILVLITSFLKKKNKNSQNNFDFNRHYFVILKPLK